MKRRLFGLCVGILSGVLAAFAFPPYHQPWLAFLGLTPLFALVAKRRGKGVALPYFGFGIGFYTFGLSWLAVVITPLGPFALSFVLSTLYAWPTGLLTGALVRRGMPLLAAAPLAWVAMDWVRSWLLTGFPWLLLGYTQAGWGTFQQAADVFGVYGLTFVMVLVNAALVDGFLRWRADGPRAALRPAAIAAAVFALVLVYGYARPGTVVERPGPKILMVQANIPQYVKTTAHAEAGRRGVRSSDMFRDHLELTAQGVAESPDVSLVVWPETMFPWSATEEEGEEGDRIRAGVARAFGHVARLSGGRPSIIGSPYYTAGMRRRNSAFHLDETGRVLGRYDKVHAVPGSEYIPFRTILPEGLLEKVTEIVAAHAGYRPDLTEGDALMLFEVDGVRYAPVICYEIIYPALVRSAARDGADVLLNITNYGWFPGTDQPEQANQMALTRAIELRRPVAVAANTGITAVFSPRGNVDELAVSGVVKEVAGVMAAEVPLSASGSPYAWWGDLPVILAAALSAVLLLPRRVWSILRAGRANRA